MIFAFFFYFFLFFLTSFFWGVCVDVWCLFCLWGVVCLLLSNTFLLRVYEKVLLF
nr:MAG TPA: hypothetical protein [Caudoviricetes sp.]